MTTYKDIFGNDLKVGDNVIFSRDRSSALTKGRIMKETKCFFIVQEVYFSPVTLTEAIYDLYDRKVEKEYARIELLKFP